MLYMGFIGSSCGLLVYALVALYRSAFRIEEGHVGLVTSMGAVLRGDDGKSLKICRPGLHLKWPWQQVHRVALMEQIIELSGADGARTAMAEDGTVLRFESILRYLPLEDTLYDYVFDLRSPREHITSLFTCLLRNEIANFRAEKDAPRGPGGSYALIRRERRKLNAQIMAFCQREIGVHYGVEFNAVDLIDILPPEELDDALNAAIQAQNEANAAYSHAEAEAQQRVIAAKHGVEIAQTKAAAVEREVLTLANRLEELDAAGTLDLYVARRNAEVLSQSKFHYVRRDR
jgi:regulator of protease activity HflC (stomatin/prohibitin superfamily)